VEGILAKHQVKHSVEWYVSGEPFFTAPGKLSDAVSAAVKAVTGSAPQLTTGGGTSDGRFIAPRGAQVVELGVVNATIHKVNECVAVDQIDALHRMYVNILQALLA
jgi:succinyl-diaminopimelate desuccinylase